MREVLSIHIGQAGVQTGTKCWELFCDEHNLDHSGQVVPRERPTKTREPVSSTSETSMEQQTEMSSEELGISSGFTSFFEEMSSGNFTPRAMMIDLEPTVVDQVKTGPYKSLYSVKQILNGKEDAANNYARGCLTVGRAMLEPVMDQLRKMLDTCDQPQGFMMYHSFGGGTGSGFSALLNENIHCDYPKLCKMGISVFPSPTMSTAVVEPYNAILDTHATLDSADCVFLVDNEAMYNICQTRLDIDSPSYGHLNRLLAQTVSSITASLRFKGTLNADFIDYQTNLVPYPRIHFPIMSYAPIVASNKASHETLSVGDLTLQAFDPQNRLFKCAAENASYIACCLLYRGDVAPKDVNAAIAALKNRKTVTFVPWSPTGFKVGINGRVPGNPYDSDLAVLRKAVCTICNTTALKHSWMSLNNKYGLMAAKKAFFHWYLLEGMDEREFYLAQENILTLEEDYTQLDTD